LEFSCQSIRESLTSFFPNASFTPLIFVLNSVYFSAVLTSAMSPQIGKNGQILNPLMNTGGYMKQTVGGPMEVTPRSRTTSTGGTRKRGDSKKCRKVYGIEHKDQWCKACIWKKACQRFPD
jgi:hypothetical protein